ncbi:MAG: hypothetical protein M3P04_14610, partial [Actinomycetota bacterium]|nr:hypothetical protein [Actinomycetota bacterium]
MRLSRRLAAAVLLVGVGRLLSPDGVPVYDGIGAPDEPYRYVAPPAGVTKTADATTAHATSPIVKGKSSYGMSLATAEVGPQFSLFVPPMAFAAPGTSLEITAVPAAPTDQPPGARIDGNVYTVSIKAAGPVTLTPQAALATLYLRSTTVKQPGPTMQYRAAGESGWTAIKTSRGGQDIYVSAFPGAGSYALAFTRTVAPEGGSSTLPYVVIGVVLLLGVV